MGKLYYVLAIVISTLYTSAYAQSQVAWKTNIEVDGFLEDWGDSLSYYFEKQDIQYAIANDHDYVYIACRIRDKQQQIQAALHGLRVTINSQGKKKDGPRVIFPLPDKAAWNGLRNSEPDIKDVRTAAIKSTRAIFVQDFDNIPNGPISLQNSFGIQSIVRLDSTDALCYEAAISLKQLHLMQHTPFAFNLKINHTTKQTYYSPDYGYSPYGYGYYGNRMRRTTTVREEPGVWLLLHLSDKQ